MACTESIPKVYLMCLGISELMVNLQTVAEDLGTACQGRRYLH